jgi:MoxR-like ATPase
MDLIRLGADDYRPSADLPYIDVFGLHKLYERIAFRANCILVGPKGIGKTLSVASWGGKRNVPVITFDCSEDVRRSHLIGTFLLKGDTSPFVLGPLTTAYEIANEVGECILNLEEINALTPQMQKVLNAAADFRNKLEVPEAETVFRLKPGAKLWIVGTMNTTVYGGVYQLNEDLKSRFRMLPLEYPRVEDLKTVVKAAARELPSDDIVDSVITLATETQTDAMEYHLSPRDVIQILEDIANVGLEDGLWMSTGKFEDTDRDTYIQRIQSTIRGVDLYDKRAVAL